MPARWRWYSRVLLAQTGVLALRWQKIVAHCGASLSFLLAFRFSMIALFFNQTLPSSIGGDAMRVWLVSKHANWRSAIYSVFLDRVIGVVALAVLVLVCLPWTLELVRNPVGRGALLLIGWGCLGAGICFVGLAWKRLRVLQHWSLTRHLAELAHVALAILRSPRSFAPAFGISVLSHLLTALAAWCAAGAIGADVPLLYTVFLVPPVILVTVVPDLDRRMGCARRRNGCCLRLRWPAAKATASLSRCCLERAYLVLGALGGLIWIANIQGVRNRRDRPAPRTLRY